MHNLLDTKIPLWYKGIMKREKMYPMIIRFHGDEKRAVKRRAKKDRVFQSQVIRNAVKMYCIESLID